MKTLLLAILHAVVTALSLFATESSAREWPLWDGRETSNEYAARVGLPATKTLDLGNGVMLELVLIPAGTFVMGTPDHVPLRDPAALNDQIGFGIALSGLCALTLVLLLIVWIVHLVRRRQRPQISLGTVLILTGLVALGFYGGSMRTRALQEIKDNEVKNNRTQWSRRDEYPAHTVTLSKPFYMGRYEVTQEQYAQIQNLNPSYYKAAKNPVERVSWEDAEAFNLKLSAVVREAIRLPTEAEWEYACRAGTITMYSSGDEDADLNRAGWYARNSNGTTHPVGEKEPNSFGLYDMHGNVWEMCRDRYKATYYAWSPNIDPAGPDKGEARVIRGGSCDGTLECRAANRGPFNSEAQYSDIGFRIVVEVPAKP